MGRFDQRWDQMTHHPNGNVFQRVDDIHPLDFYLGREQTCERILMLMTDHELPPSHEYQSIHIMCRRRPDGRNILQFRLVISELGKLFSLLCEDLVESSRHLSDSPQAVQFILNRFKRWQKLFITGGSGLLDEHALRGLVGELLFLEQIAIPRYGADSALKGWLGPAGADQDFSLPDGLFEVKTIRHGASKVTLSSAEQLDTENLPLELIVVELDDAGALQLPDKVFDPLQLVTRITQSLTPDQGNVDLFESKLLQAGFISRVDYSTYKYVLRGIRRFRVSDTFPSIRRSRLPNGIGALTYEIELSSILGFEINTDTSEATNVHR